MDMNKVDPIYECEDDVFFAEIRKQILVLTADDEETGPGSRRSGSRSCSLLQHGRYYSWPESKNTDSVPAWLENLWKTGNGTGVFIPHITKSTRRHRPGRMNRRKVYRPVETKQS